MKILKTKLDECKPENLCSTAPDEDTDSLSLLQLSGLWEFCNIVAIIALLCKMLRSIYRKINPDRRRNLQRFYRLGKPSRYDIVIDGHVCRENEFHLQKSISLISNESHDEKDEDCNNVTMQSCTDNVMLNE